MRCSNLCSSPVGHCPAIWDFKVVRYTNTNPIAGCTQFQIEFIVSNTIQEDITDVNLDLFVLPTFMTVTDPGDFCPPLLLSTSPATCAQARITS
ncbi:MAG: hypothetical protein IPN76_33500 [Saprospiraceae bacterium]|nr:hypothetical protein [Saprospiraceae bacterium]